MEIEVALDLSISSDQMILITIHTEYANVDHLAWVVWWPPIQKFWGERQFYKEMFGLYKQRLQILELMASINISAEPPSIVSGRWVLPGISIANLG